MPIIITDTHLATIQKLENLLVARIEENASPPTVKKAYLNLHHYLSEHFFDRPYDGSFTWIDILRHTWANQVNVPLGFIIYDIEHSDRRDYRHDPRTLAVARRTSRLFQEMRALEALPCETPMSDFVDAALRLADPDKAHAIKIIGADVLEVLSGLTQRNAENKFHNFAIVLELLNNAVKYSPAGSEIVLTFASKLELYYTRTVIEVTPSGLEVRRPTEKSKSYEITNFCVTVTDHGIGIPTDEIPKILALGNYRATNTASYFGTGFGLSSVVAHSNHPIIDICPPPAGKLRSELSWRVHYRPTPQLLTLSKKRPQLPKATVFFITPNPYFL
jgi:hypothetical protein